MRKTSKKVKLLKALIIFNVGVVAVLSWIGYKSDPGTYGPKTQNKAG